MINLEKLHVDITRKSWVNEFIEDVGNALHKAMDNGLKESQIEKMLNEIVEIIVSFGYSYAVKGKI